MAVKSKAEIKSAFEKGDEPSETDFGSFIDSFVPISSDGEVGIMEVISTASSIARPAETLVAIATAVQGGKTGVIEIQGTAAVTALPVAAAGRAVLAASAASSARSEISAQEDVINARGDIVRGSSTAVAEKLAKGAANLMLGADANDVLYLGGTEATAASFTIGAADHKKTFLVNATAAAATVTLGAAATLGDNFTVVVKKIDDSTNTITIDADGTETIDGALTQSIGTQYQALKFVCDGATWHIESLSRTDNALVLIASAMASSSATVEFTDLDDTYDHFILDCIRVRPATDDVSFLVRLSDDNGSTFKAGSTDYRTAAAGAAFTSTSAMQYNDAPGTDGLSNAAGEFYNARLLISAPSDNAKTYVLGSYWYVRADGAASANQRIGFYNTAAVIDAIQILLSSGNIAEGEFKLYGVQKS